MVNISRETREEAASCLERVIRRSRLTVYDGLFYFQEFPLAAFREHADPEALALVRDDRTWSQLVPYRGPAPVAGSIELFCLWRFHFPVGVDNSGFVGWLATRLKDRFGTGVFVVCGQNSEDGGIFDYWGGPAQLRTELIGEVSRLVRPAEGS